MFLSNEFEDKPSSITRGLFIENRRDIMHYEKLSPFPNDFLWGASTSAYQVEGASLQDGKGQTCQDVKEIPEGTSDLKVCSDHYHHYKEDIALMAEMGFKVYRFSISWARVLPNGKGQVNDKGIKFYDDIINECLKYNIIPLVTMFHFDMPHELDKLGGWSKRDSIDWFSDYAKLLYESYGDRVKYWLTINEQNMLVLDGPIMGTLSLPQDCTNELKEIYQQNHHMLLAQAKAMKLCHSMLPDAKIGPAPNIALAYAASCNPKDIIAAQNYNAIRNWLYLDASVYGEYNTILWSYLKQRDALPSILPGDKELLKSGAPDYIGFNYYNTATCQHCDSDEEEALDGDQQTAGTDPGVYKGFKNPHLPRSDFGWEIDPIGFRATMREIDSRYHLPLIITENGLGAYDKLVDGSVHDDYRINYLREHIEQIQQSITDGINIFGYCPWSAVDLISTHEGMVKRYGFIYVDRDEFDIKNCDRYRKDSFYWYKKVIASNGEDL